MAPETITAKELAKIMDKSDRNIRRRADKEKWPSRTLNGRGDKAYLVASLPDDVRLQVTMARSRGNGERGTGVSLYNKVSLAPRPVPVGSPDLPDYKNRIALARTDLVRMYLAEKDRAKAAGESVTASAKLYIKGYNTGHLHPRLFEILGPTSFASVESWVRQLRQAGMDYTALAPSWGNRAGISKLTDQEFNTALSYLLHPNRLRMSEVARLTQLTLRRRGADALSSPDTIRRALTQWKNTHYDQYVFCREGEKALNDKCLPYLERDIGLLDVGDVLVADGHTLNFHVLHPFTGKPVRMTMISWYDWASCYPVGQEIMPTENVQSIAAGLRRAILTIGKMPKVAYLDNGKAFKAKLFTDKAIDFEEMGFYGMFARLGVETLFAWPYNAQSKVVERFFGTFNELERLMPTYSGASIQDKPAHMNRNEKLHQAIHQKRYGGWVPTAAEAMQIIHGWVKEYAARPHAGLKGLCPGDVLAAGRGPGIDEEALRFLMMSMEVKSVYRNGIHLFGRNYYDDALYGYRDRVLVRYDLENLSRLYVYDKTGTRCICVAEPVQKVHPVARILGTKDDLEAVKEGIKHKRHLKKATEAVARAYVEEAPVLVEMPERGMRNAELGTRKSEGGSRKSEVGRLPRGEAEKIEAEAARMKVIELKPRKAEQIYVSESDRYEDLLERECKGEALELDDMAFMRYFERTDMWKELSGRFEFLRELYLAPEGMAGDRTD
jgi:putative transposase